ncbi:MAG: hypothetical protein AAGG00_10465 [Cyanobacteria bacterium P01_H01_bin.150]
MTVLPLKIRFWAALCHLSTNFWLFLLFLFFSVLLPFIESIEVVRSECLLKPFSGCDKNEVFLILSFSILAELILLLVLPYIGVLIVYTILHLKGKAHPFIKNHAKSALEFQVGLSVSLGLLNLIGACILLIIGIPTTVRGLAKILFIIFTMNVFTFIIIAGFQIIITLIATVQSLRGHFFRYFVIFAD